MITAKEAWKQSKYYCQYMDYMDRAKEWIATHGDYCYVQLIEADG